MTTDLSVGTASGLWRLAVRPAFVLIDGIGIVLLGASAAIGALGPAASGGGAMWAGVLAAIGSALLAVGLSLPIGTYFQLRSNAEALSILDACSRSGIRAIFKNRSEAAVALRSAIDLAAASSSQIDLLGIAFRSLFNPAGDYTRQMRERLDDPRVGLRVLLLDPDSDAAKKRATKELGNTTIDDIRFTLHNGLPATVAERIKRIQAQQAGGASDQRINVEVRLYDSEPVVFLMMFGGSLFCEQYHCGRPNGLRAGSCIGKQMPVVEYAGSAHASPFLQAHFEEMWASASDVTSDVLAKSHQFTSGLKPRIVAQSAMSDLPARSQILINGES
jgi:hypothetical protein